MIRPNSCYLRTCDTRLWYSNLPNPRCRELYILPHFRFRDDHSCILCATTPIGTQHCQALATNSSGSCGTPRTGPDRCEAVTAEATAAADLAVAGLVEVAAAAAATAAATAEVAMVEAATVEVATGVGEGGIDHLMQT